MTLTQITEKGIKDGEIINADINASAAIAGSKIAPAFTSNISITNANPNITFFDSDANSDFKIDVNGGLFTIKDHTNADASRMSIASDGKLSIDRTHASATTGTHPALDIDTHANGTAGATFATGIDFRIAGVHKKRLAITNADSSAGTGDWVFYRDNGGNECMRLTSDGNIAFNRPNATVGDNQSGNSTATPKRFVFNNDHSSGYTDGSLKLYLFNGGTTRHGFTSGPNYDLQYHSSGSATEAKHTFFTQNTERLRIASDGKLSIDRTHASATTGNHPALDIDTHANGTAGATFATGIDFRIAGVHKKRLAITNADSSTGTGDWVFYRDNGSNEGIRILNGGGITFNGDTAAANALDDYEEGPFTPAFANGLVASSYESNGQKGVYTKIGRYVYGTILLHLASASTQNSNVIDIHGLPFTAGNNSTIGGQSGGAQYFYQDGFYNSNGFTGIVISNSTAIRLYRADTGAYLTGTSVNGGREIRVDFSYHAA